jgi:predicted amidohydrolase YtcJ
MGPGTLVTPRTKRSFLFKTLPEMGLCVGGSSDTAGAVPEALDPMYQIWCMVNRKAIDGSPVSPEEKIPVMEAIKVYTIHSAYAAREEHIKGSIEEGKLADFVVLDRDPFAIDEDDLRKVCVHMTIVGGRVVYQRENA